MAEKSRLNLRRLRLQHPSRGTAGESSSARERWRVVRLRRELHEPALRVLSGLSHGRRHDLDGRETQVLRLFRAEIWVLCYNLRHGRLA